MKADLVQLYTPSGQRLSEDVDRIPWEAYPRPRLKRDSFFNLNGWWDFAVTSNREKVPESYEQKIRVPFCPESLLSGIAQVPQPNSCLWYQRDFVLPENFCIERVLLHIGAADQKAYIYCNDHFVGAHTGGYDPITLDITDYLQEQNTLTIQVEDDLDCAVLPYGKQKHQRGGMWYTPVSGIWQTVWLESVPTVYVKSLSVTTDGGGVTICAEGVTDGAVTVVTPQGNVLVPMQDGIARVDLPETRLWCPEDPYLYTFTVETGDDTVQSYFAIRTLSVRHIDGVPRMCLNGKPIFFHAVLDQGYWSDGLFTPPEPTCYAWDIAKMQELGFNTLRKHIKVEAEQFYYDCDRMGMLVWQDMVNNGHYSFVRDTALPTAGLKSLPDKHMHRDAATREAFVDGMKKTVYQLSDHPSIVGWTIFNEGWGQFDSDTMYNCLRQLDMTRFIDTASGWFKGAQSDVVSEHVYFKPYRHRSGNKPVFLSEFGGYSYKPQDHIFNRTQTYGYRMFDNPQSYMDAVEKLYRQEIVPAVSKGLCGAVYTQLSDVEDETNGLYSYDRRVCKVDITRMKAIAAELMIKAEESE